MPSGRVGLVGRHMCSHTHPGALKGPILGLMLCCSHLEVRNGFWTSTPRFHFVPGPTDFEASPTFCSSEIEGMHIASIPGLILFSTVSHLLNDHSQAPLWFSRTHYILPYTCFSHGVSWSLALFFLHRIVLTSLYLVSSCMFFEILLISFRIPFLDSCAWAMGL